MQLQRASLHPKCSLKKKKKKRACSQEKAASTLLGWWLQLPGSGGWECDPGERPSLPETQSHRVNIDWEQGVAESLFPPALPRCVPPPSEHPSPPCTAQNINWKLVPTVIKGHGLRRREKRTSVCAGLTCLFALQVGKHLLQLVIWEDARWVGGGMRDWEAPSEVLPSLSRASHPKFSGCWYTADKGVVWYTVSGKTRAWVHAVSAPRCTDATVN